MCEMVDRDLIPLLITDDMQLAMLRPSNVDDLKAATLATGHVPLTGFKYEHVPAFVASWRPQTAQLEAGVEALIGYLPIDLWQDQLDRQGLVLQWAQAIVAGDWSQVSDCQRWLYVPLRRDQFHQAVGEVRERAEAAKELGHDAVTRLADTLLGHLSVVDVADSPATPLPSEATVKALQDWYAPHMALIESVVDQCGVPAKGKVDAMKVAEVFTTVYGSAGVTGYVSDEVDSVTFRQSEARVHIPSKREWTRKSLLKLLAHENVHIRRFCNGWAGGLALGAFGLPGYIDWEEGTSTALGKVYAADADSAVTSYALPEAFVAIGLASGLAGTFSSDQLYQVLIGRYALVEAIKQAKTPEGVDMDGVVKKGRETAWTRLLRTYRGTSGLGDDGQCCLRDKCYRVGNEGFWGALAGKEFDLDLALMCKGDLRSTEHLAYARLCRAALPAS